MIDRRFWWMIVCIFLFKLWLFTGLDLYVIGNAEHDDYLFVHQALNIIQGNWLGDFNNKTLAKGCFFPIFLAINHITGLPLLIVEQAIYLVAGTLLIVPLRTSGRKNSIVLISFYALYAFNPAVSCLNFTRVIRDSLYVGEVMLIFAAFVSVIFLFFEEKRAGKWLILLGLSLSSFWLTREEGMWLAPSLFLFYLIIFFILRSRGIHSNTSKSMIFMIAPILILLFSIESIEIINYMKYGVAVRTEFQTDYFKSAMGALTRIRHERFRPYVQVPEDVRVKAYEVSPSFSKLREYLEGRELKNWIREGKEYINPADDYSSHFIWALRDAVAHAGYYQSALKAKKLYQAIGKEINKACDMGLLEAQTKKRVTLLPVFRNEYIIPLMRALMRSLVFVNGFNFRVIDESMNAGSSERQKLFEAITNHNCDINQSGNIHVTGWVFNKTCKTDLCLGDRTDDGPEKKIEFQESNNVYMNFMKKESNGNYLSQDRKCRYNFEGKIDEELIIKENGIVIFSNPLSGIKSPPKNLPEKILLEIDNAEFDNSNIKSIDIQKKAVLKKTGEVYKVLGIPLFIVAFMFFLFRLTYGLIHNRMHLLTLYNVILFTGILSRHILLAYLEVTSFSGINTLYHQPTFALSIVFVFMSLADGLNLLEQKTIKIY